MGMEPWSHHASPLPPHTPQKNQQKTAYNRGIGSVDKAATQQSVYYMTFSCIDLVLVFFGRQYLV